jgi:hypothetical protein
MTERDEKEASAMNAMGENEDVRLGERRRKTMGESEDVKLGERKAARANVGGAERGRLRVRKPALSKTFSALSFFASGEDF